MTASFASTIRGRYYDGGVKITYGTYESAGDGEGGDIDTGIDVCYWIKLQPKSDTVIATESVVNASFPCAGHAVAIVTSVNEAGTWEAIGEGE